jgi:phospholipid/cholesterol/gamma-HCH transport system substrate-binding protein
MKARRDQAVVGLFVIVAGALLVGTVFAISGAVGRTVKTYHSYFPFAGGIEPGATVRYAGGPKVGRVEQIRIDPQNPSRVEVTFSVQSDLPVKTDSHVRIMSVSPLGDNHVEIYPGGAQSPSAPGGSALPSDIYLDFNALAEQINNIAPDARRLLGTLNDRATELKTTVDRVNGLLSPENRSNLSATLANTRGMIEENRPQIRSTLQHVNELSQKLDPLIQDLRKTSNQANQALDHIDSLIGENRADIRKAVIELRQSLGKVNDITGRLDQTLDVNAENIDEVLENLRHVTENLKEFTDTIKTRPYTLIRSSAPREHKPGEPK